MRTDRIRGFRAHALLAICALALLATSAHAADDKGSLSGTVTDEAGKAVVGLSLRLEQDIPMEAQRGKKGKQGGGTKIVGRAVSDQQGNFALPALDPGTYRLVAGSQNVGWIYMEVTVTAGKETKLGNLKLTKV